MNDKQSNMPFQYTYSAKEQEEIKRIRSKYVPEEESKMEKLRRLDNNVTSKAIACALSVGIGGTLILGIGMSCCMVWGGTAFVPGIVIGFVGIAMLSSAHPMYNYVLRKERKRIALEILRLTDELIK